MKQQKLSHDGPLVLCILDGWGHNTQHSNNSISMAQTPFLDKMYINWPTALLNTSSTEVGLPVGQVGNSEVGHMNIGAGRIIPQDLPRIDNAIRDGSLESNPRLIKFIKNLKKSGGTCNLIGLLSQGGVHSHQNHMIALAKIVLSANVPLCLHAITDGRDTPPKNALNDIDKFLSELQEYKIFKIATIAGRYYAMDRDQRWDRVEKSWRAIQLGEGEFSPDIISTINQAYNKNVTDEFILPTVIGNYSGIQDGDGLLVANFRSDRVREILSSLADPNFLEFSRPRVSKFAGLMGMVSYSQQLDKLFGSLFKSGKLECTLGELVANSGIKQLRVAETEKYAHVTFFFNGGQESPFPGEKRILIPSPQVATYDLKPEMSAPAVTKALIDAINSNEFGFIVVNYANGDMVGHTGNLEAAIIAAETIDICLGKLEEAVLNANGTMLITADHGNCEKMLDFDTGQPHTSHTINPVPVILAGAPHGINAIENGRLSDVAPTLLDLLNLEKPALMTGNSLLRGPGVKHFVAAG